ncbi:MAG: uracil phosphoribosyltransferase [Flavobacteriaceae bacterium]|nr:uracil phosphoribosyltransferase [Flavobacteriaceae bacterium]
MKNFFEAIAWLFEEILFIPFNFLRQLELENWWLANSITWSFLVLGVCASVYWINQLRIFDKKGEEDKDPSAHSFL